MEQDIVIIDSFSFEALYSFLKRTNLELLGEALQHFVELDKISTLDRLGQL